MAEIKTQRIRMKVSRGNPSGGPVIRAGATIEISEFWAQRFIADGTAELVEDQPAQPKAEPKKKGKK
jgi:hypothetical protein